MRFLDELAKVEADFEAEAQRLDPEGLLHWQFVVAAAQRAPIEHSEAADLMVLGARGRGAVGSAILGSVATWMLHHCRSPPLVTPESTSS